VLILALIAKPSADLTNVLNGSKTDANLSLWFKFHVGISYDESFDRWSGNINFNYTTQAIPVVILLSLASVPMATYVGLSSFNIAK
jgi:hypothetical protein